MRFLSVATTLLALAFSASSFAAQDCGPIDDSLEKKECYEENLQTATGLMHAEFDAAKARLADFFRNEADEKEEAFARLLAAQASWNQYSVSECAVQSLGALRGSRDASKQVACQIDLTEKRTQELRNVGKFEFEY